MFEAEMNPMKRTLQIAAGIGILGVLLVVFQNCGENPEMSDAQPGGVQVKTDKVIADATTFDHVTYTPNTFTGSDLKMQIMRLDLPAGQISYESAHPVSCALDATRLQSLRTLLTNARICEPGPLPPESATCMAIGVEDIELSTGTHSTNLRPVICHNGVFLCDDKDAEFRKLLEDLRLYPPPGC